jgi:hypothetical protein
MFENRNYLIIPVSELSKVNFDEVCETSIETVRKSADNQKTFIKWDNAEPSFINELIGAEGPYTHEEFMDILDTVDWYVDLTPEEEE